jgi:hypothetical protein
MGTTVPIDSLENTEDVASGAYGDLVIAGSFIPVKKEQVRKSGNPRQATIMILLRRRLWL